MHPPSGLLRYILKACVAQILLQKSHLNVENFLRAIGARRGARCHDPPPPLWPCNKVLKSNFQSIISQTNNNCSLLSLILAKRFLLDISCENIFALSVAVWSKPWPASCMWPAGNFCAALEHFNLRCLFCI